MASTPNQLHRPIWSLQRKANQYIVELPKAVVSSTLAPGLIQHMKLKRKLPGVLSIRCVVPGSSDRQKRSSSVFDHTSTQLKLPASYLLINAVNAAAASVALGQIDAILHQACGMRISSVIQHMPCAVGRFLIHHDVKFSQINVQARHVLLDGKNQASLVFSGVDWGGPTLILLLAVQRAFERAGVKAESLGIAKSLVWQYLGGPTHDLANRLQFVDDMLSKVIVMRLMWFRYAPLFSIRFSEKQPTALEFVEKCGVGLWVEMNAYDAVNGTVYPGEGDLHVCGTANAVDVAVERLRTMQASGYPHIITIRDATVPHMGSGLWRMRPDNSIDEPLWQLAFGSAVGEHEILALGERLNCCIKRGKGAGRGNPKDRTALKCMIKRHCLLVMVDLCTERNGKIGHCSVIGCAEAVSKFLQACASINVGDRVQVEWKGQEWEAIVSGCHLYFRPGMFGVIEDAWYELIDPQGHWGPWFAKDFLVSHSSPWPVARPQLGTSSAPKESDPHVGILSVPLSASEKCDSDEPVRANTKEKVARIGEAEAAEIVSLQQADFIQRLAPSAVMETASDKPIDELGQQETVVLLLHFNRCPKPAREALRTGVPLRQCRDALDAEGLPWTLPSGAMVFIKPCHYRMVMRGLNGKTLKTSHVVVLEEYEYLVEESIANVMGTCQGVWCKSRMVLPEPTDDMSVATAGSTLGADGDENVKDQNLHLDTSASNNAKSNEPLSIWECLDVQRTFVTIRTPLRAQDSVTQSTTDATLGHEQNPRRRIAAVGDS